MLLLLVVVSVLWVQGGMEDAAAAAVVVVVAVGNIGIADVNAAGGGDRADGAIGAVVVALVGCAVSALG